MIDILKEPIKRRILVLLVVFVVGILIVVTTNHVVYAISEEYDEYIKNQDTRYKLGMIIIQKLDSIEKNFLTISKIENSNELDIYTSLVSSNIFDIKQILTVLQNGGEYQHTLDTNFGNVDEITETYYYTRSDTEDILIEVIDLTPKILEIQILSNELIQLVDNKLKSTDELEIQNYELELSLLLKQADTYFQRSHEHAAEIFYNSQQEINRLEQKRDTVVGQYQLYYYSTLIFVGIVIAIISKHIMSQIGIIIKERKKIQDSLRKSLDTTETILEKLPIGVAIVGKDRKVSRVNNAALDIMNKSEEDIVGNICHKNICPTQIGKCPILDLGKKVDNSEKVVVASDGHIIPVLKTAIPISLDGEDVLLEAFVDISDRKKSEKELKIKSMELQENKKELEKILKQKDGFIGQLSHDLKSPLSPLVTLLPIIRNKVKDKKIIEMLDMSIRSTNILQEIIYKTLNLARLNSPNVSFEFEQINLQKISNDVINNKEIFFEKHKATLENRIDNNIEVFADKLRIGEIFDNLLSNAVKYMPDGGNVIIDAEKMKDYIKISISDEGIGLSNFEIPQIFNEFYKVDESRHDLDSSGLGLSICKRIVEKHGGKIWAKSLGKGKGSTFYFTLKTYQN